MQDQKMGDRFVVHKLYESSKECVMWGSHAVAVAVAVAKAVTLAVAKAVAVAVAVAVAGAKLTRRVPPAC